MKAKTFKQALVILDSVKGQPVASALHEVGGWRGLFDLASSEYHEQPDMQAKWNVIEQLKELFECNFTDLVFLFTQGYSSLHQRYIVDDLPYALRHYAEITLEAKRLWILLSRFSGHILFSKENKPKKPERTRQTAPRLSQDAIMSQEKAEGMHLTICRLRTLLLNRLKQKTACTWCGQDVATMAFWDGDLLCDRCGKSYEKIVSDNSSPETWPLRKVVGYTETGADKLECGHVAGQAFRMGRRHDRQKRRCIFCGYPKLSKLKENREKQRTTTASKHSS